MIQSNTSYIVVPMEVMDRLNHQLFIFRYSPKLTDKLKGK